MGDQDERDEHEQVQRGDTSRAQVDPNVCAFERIKHEDETGEYWLGRELSLLLGYDKWQNPNG